MKTFLIFTHGDQFCSEVFETVLECRDFGSVNDGHRLYVGTFTQVVPGDTLEIPFGSGSWLADQRCDNLAVVI